MDKIINPCESVIIGGKEYTINTDFSVWIEIEELFLQNKFLDGTAARILKLAYPVLPSSPIEAFEKILWFYACGELTERKQEKGITKAPVINLKKDFQYIWAAFLGEFGIDLSVQHLHWWKFRILMSALSEECKFSRIISYRSINTMDVKDKNARIFYEKMKQKYRLDDYRTEEERDQQTALMIERLF